MNRASWLIGLLLSVLTLPVLAEEVEVIQDNGDPANRIDLVIMGDGYRDVDQVKLTTDTLSFLSTFWGESPLGEYQSYFNVKLIHVISVENGADNGTYGAVRDTALGAYYNCYNIDRLLCVNTGAVFAMANANVPEYDYIMVIVNDPKYGGAGGSVATFSVNSSAGLIAIHEFGHMFASLADEYEDAYPGYPTCGSDCPEPNATNHTVREEVKWNLWIDGATPVPTPETSTYQNLVGLFEGARYFSSGVYRPRMSCAMRALGADFGEVCQEALVKSVYNEVSTIDAATPPGAVSLSGCESAILSVAGPHPAPDTMINTWTVDGQVEQVGQDALTVSALALGDGLHQVTVEVADGTLLVRNDPGDLLRDSHTWQVTVSQVGQGACLIGGDCIPEGQADPQNPCRVCRSAVDNAGWTVIDGESCSDGVFCNGEEICVADLCSAGQSPCDDDGLDCTTTCDEGTATCNALAADVCLIDGACVGSGQAHPDNPCQECDPANNQTNWTALNGTACSDGLYCNGQEQCQDGFCSAPSTPCPNDGLACTTTCDEASGACNVLAADTCLIDGACVAAGEGSPDDPCRQCLPQVATDAWSPAPDGADCGDGQFCNGAETCQAGVCQQAGPPCADDGLACTNTCDEPAQACNSLLANYCLLAGACVPAGAVDPNNPCLTCQPGVDTGAYSPDDTQACDDGLACTTGDRCAAGVCQGDFQVGCCEQDGDPCDDGDPCTESDACHNGACQPGEALCTDACPCEKKVGGGCSCSTDGAGSGMLGLLLLAAAWFGRRRRL